MSSCFYYVLKAIAEVMGYTVGIGVLILPFLFQKTGMVPSIFLLSATAFVLLPFAFIFNDLLDLDTNVNKAVDKILGNNLTFVFYTIFVYGALASYIIASGDQLYAWLGGNAKYWSTLFFILALFPFFGSGIASFLQFFFSILLLALIIAIIPINAARASFSYPPFSNFSYAPLLIAVSLFALAGHESIAHLRRKMRKEEAFSAFFVGFSLSYIIYSLYAITASSLAEVGILSTSSLLPFYSPFLRLLISLIAILAFYTSFYAIGNEWLENSKRFMKRNAAYAFLFIPVAILYLLVRNGFLNILHLILIGSFGYSLILSFSAMAHSKLKGKTTISKKLSKALSILFALLSAIFIISLFF